MARDRLAAIRAQQGAQGEEQSYPQQQQERGHRGQPQPHQAYQQPSQGQYYQHEPQYYSEDAPPPPPPHSSSRSNGNSRHGSRSNSRGDGDHRRPQQAPPPQDMPDFTTPTMDNGRGSFDYVDGAVDFNPNATAYGAGQQQYGNYYDQPAPVHAPVRPGPAQSQYRPENPVRTRQRSLSGGQRSAAAREARDQGRQEYGQYEQYMPQVSHQHSARSVPSYDDMGAQYDDKAGSTAHLVRGQSDFSGKESYEMKGRKGSATRPGTIGNRGGPAIRKGEVPYEEMSDFFSQISDLQSALREANGMIQHIQQMQMRMLSLPSADDPQAVQLTGQLKQATQDTRSYFNQLKARITDLDQGNANLRAMIPLGQSIMQLTLADVQVRATQVEALKERFKDAIQRYAEVERDHRAKNRSRMERQVKIVNPNMGQQEIQSVVREAEQNGGSGLFSQALLQSGGQRSYAARGALREVESRAAELARIEETLVELAQLFNDMAVMVEAQDVQVVAIEQNAVQVERDMEVGVKEVKQAVVHARNARKWRWICFAIILVILAVVAVVVVIKVVLPLVNKNKAAN